MRNSLLILALSLSSVAAHGLTLRELNGLKAPFSLPKLPYATTALEPAIDKETMEIHHGRHHKAYVDNLNKALEGQKSDNLLAILKGISTKTPAERNNGGGHWNHAFFWSIFSADAKQREMPKRLAAEIDKKFGSLDKFKEDFQKAGAGQFGSGWVWLIRTPEGELAITTTANQDNPLMDVASTRGWPILGFDVWEHAYYLKYQNKRADYLQAMWNIVNWKQVDAYDAEVMKMKDRKL